MTTTSLTPLFAPCMPLALLQADFIIKVYISAVSKRFYFPSCSSRRTQRGERAKPHMSCSITVRARFAVLSIVRSRLPPALTLFTFAHLLHPLSLLDVPSAAHSRATARSLRAPCCAGVRLDTSGIVRRRLAALDVVQAMPKEQTELHLHLVDGQEVACLRLTTRLRRERQWGGG